MPRFIGLVAARAFLALALLVIGFSAHASHFRGGSVTWTVPNPSTAPLTVEFTVTVAWRAASGAGESTTLGFGDGTPNNLATVGAVIGSGTDTAGVAYVVNQYIVSHTYASAGTFPAGLVSNCCRVSSLQGGNGNANFSVPATVSLAGGNTAGPQFSASNYYSLQVGAVRSIYLPVSDPDGDAVTCRFATTAETGLVTAPVPVPASGAVPTLTSVPGGCVLTWDVTAAVAGQIYPVPVVAQSTHAGQTSTSMYDIMIAMTTVAAPTCTGSTSQTVTVGTAYTFPVVGTLAASTLALTAIGVPAGAVFTPGLGTSGASPYSASMAWTPTVGDAGQSKSVQVIYTDPGTNTQGICSLQLNVASFTVTATANPVGGGTVSCAPPAVVSGGSSTCTATPNAGYTFTSFAGDCTGATCVLTNVLANKAVTANFTLNTYNVVGTAAPLAGGSVVCTPNPVNHGSNASCTATPNVGYTFTAFSGDCTGATCTITNVTANKAVTGTFTLNTYSVVGTAAPLAGGSVVCTPNPVNHGSNASCTATPNVGYTFTAFSGDCAGASCSLTNVTANKAVTGTFTLNTYSVVGTAAPLAGGSVVCTPNPVNHGSNASCTATPNVGYTFTAFSGDCTGATCSIINVTANKAVTGTFTLNTYSVVGTAAPLAGGSVVCTPNPVNHGSNASCTATPNVGYTFTAFSGDCTGATCNMTNVTANKAVTGTFTLNTYSVVGTANPAAGGTVTCTPNPVDHGSSTNCTVATNSNFTFVGFTGDCTGMTCALTNVIAPRAVTANFTLNTTVSGPTSTGTGPATATVTGGGATCGFDLSNSAFVAPTQGYPIIGSSFPHGWFKLRLVGCTNGSTARVSISWPSLGSMAYLTYGPTPASPNVSLFYPPSNIIESGNTISFDVTDGALGDDNLLADGIIANMGGPLQLAEPVSVPSLRDSAVYLMALLLLLTGLFSGWRRHPLQ